ncbi:MAG: c-type cytochrome biogenesis protein CcsB [Planctomycetes bacterium]|nr:c-type cytochrome biogenesis protein CcsB [Planctomycetota bacterium]
MNLAAFFADHPLVAGLLALHAAVMVAWAAGALSRRPRVVHVAVWLTVAAFLLNTAVLVDRWVEAGRAPFKTLFETLLLYPWCVSAVTLALLAMHRVTVLLPFASGVSAAGLVYAGLKPVVEIVTLPPALQSGWFVPHVVTYFVAYAGLFASAVFALLAVTRFRAGSVSVRSSAVRRSSADALTGALQTAPAGEPRFEQFAHRAAVFGFTALTVGLVMGAAWGKAAWGDYWSWDPKENWALVTWLAYLIYMHLRLVGGWQGRRAMAVCLLSFAAVVFTYLGMSMLPSASDSLHVYQ